MGKARRRPFNLEKHNHTEENVRTDCPQLLPAGPTAEGFSCGVKQFPCKLQFRPLLGSLVHFRRVAGFNIPSYFEMCLIRKGLNSSHLEMYDGGLVL